MPDKRDMTHNRGAGRSGDAAPRKRAWVVVLGDFGRSPRMQYHALSLAEQVRAGATASPITMGYFHTICVSVEPPAASLHMAATPAYRAAL